jgi:hypothetical protein
LGDALKVRTSTDATQWRRNDAMAALLGCQMLSGFFNRDDFGKEAIWTLEAFAPSKTGQSCQQAVCGGPLISVYRDVGSVEIEFSARQSQVYFLAVH